MIAADGWNVEFDVSLWGLGHHSRRHSAVQRPRYCVVSLNVVAVIVVFFLLNRENLESGITDTCKNQQAAKETASALLSQLFNNNSLVTLNWQIMTKIYR
jgi:hypothetical protein